MDYLCATFGDFSFSHFAFYHADRQTHTDTITEAGQRYTHTTTVRVSINKALVITSVVLETVQPCHEMLHQNVCQATW